MKNAPQTKSTAPASAVECSGARTSSQSPKPAAPANMKRHRAFDIIAAESAPISAPAPKHAEMIPNVRGPASSVFFASSGRMMLKLKQTDENTTIIERITSTVRLRRA